MVVNPGSDSAADRLWWFRGADEPRPPARRARWRLTPRERLDALACLAVAALWFSPACRELLFRADRDFYNRIPLAGSTLTALALNILVLAALGFAAVTALRRTRRPAWRRAGAAVGAAALVIALNSARITYVRWPDTLGVVAVALIGLLALGSALRWPETALRATRKLALVASPVAGVTLAFVVWMFLEAAAGPVYRLAEPAPLKRTPPSLRRVVWLVLEDFDPRLAFEARPAGLELPELDRLWRESLYADGARPPAGTPELSIPALITGRPVVSVTPLNPNDLELRFTDGKTARWSAQANVFARARTLGYDTAVVGSHLPYPRVLGGALGYADWRASVTHEAARGETLGEALAAQWMTLAPAVHRRRLALRRFEELIDLAARAATDRRFGLVLLHLPIPRGPAIYDHAEGRLTPWNFGGPGASALDNLALVDRSLGHLRRGLERARLDDTTWFLLTSATWAPPHDGHADHRVPFLLRPPDGGRAAHVDMAFNTLTAHDLVLAILRGSVSDTREAVAWLGRQPVAPPKTYAPDGRPLY